MTVSETEIIDSVGVLKDEEFERAQSMAIEGDREAFGHYLASAMRGNPVSAYMVSQYYAKGLVDGGTVRTVFWSVYSALGYYVPAEGTLRVWLNAPDAPEPKEFLVFCRKEADAGNGAAMFLAGMAHYTGRGAVFDPAAAFGYFERSYQTGNLDGKCQYALCLIRGAGTGQDLEKGLGLLRETVAEGCIRAAVKYAQCLEQGIFVKKDCGKALRIYERLASRRVPRGMYEAGRCSLDGIGTERDPDMGYSWFTLSQAFGSVWGDFGMARCMMGGIVENCREEGTKLMIESAEKGCTDAMIMASQLYAKGGKILKKDVDRSIAYLRMAAEMGNASAELTLSKYYADGTDVKKDSRLSVEYALRSAAHGNTEGCYVAGTCYLSGKGLPKDPARGFALIRISSDAGFMKATYALANCYLHGTGTNKDYTKARELHRSLADRGFAKSMFYLGESYYLGEQVPQDYAEAFRLFSKGAELDNALCQYYLGECYMNGHGVKADESVALKWYKKAADQGHVISQRIIEDRRNREILEDQTPFATFEKSARSGNAQSMYIVGRYYEDGIGIEKDLNKAKDWYRKAKKRGNSAAKRALEALEKAESEKKE